MNHLGFVTWIAKAGDCSTAPTDNKTVKQILAPPTLLSQPGNRSPNFSGKTGSNLVWTLVPGMCSYGKLLQEEGKYIIQEAHWEPLLWHLTTLKTWSLAKTCCRWLKETAFEHQQSRSRLVPPYWQQSRNFQRNPDWMEITEGLDLGRCLTTVCWSEWLNAQQEGTMPFTLFDGFDNLSWNFARTR